METIISLVFVLFVLCLGIYSLGACFHYMWKIVVLSCRYRNPQKSSDGPSNQATIGTTNVAAPTSKSQRWSFLELVAAIFGMVP
jgi:hypothetical protein